MAEFSHQILGHVYVEIALYRNAKNVMEFGGARLLELDGVNGCKQFYQWTIRITGGRWIPDAKVRPQLSPYLNKNYETFWRLKFGGRTFFSATRAFCAFKLLIPEPIVQVWSPKSRIKRSFFQRWNCSMVAEKAGNQSQSIGRWCGVSMIEVSVDLRS